MLTDIEISDFRGFGNVKLKGLGLVNLIVGKNNAGKTSLLEAVAAATNSHSFSGLPDLFRAAQNKARSQADLNRSYQWLVRDGAVESKAKIWAQDERGDWEVIIQLERNSQNLGQMWGHSFPGYHGQSSFPGGKAAMIRRMPTFRLRSVSVQHQTPEDLVEAFAEAVRPPEGEAQMEALLHEVDDRVRTVRLDYAQGSQPFIVVDIGLSQRVPLPQAGQGIYRLVAIFSELLGQRPQICFIDEIENGIHYTVLPQVWKGIAEVAERLGVQVFATTHSGECLAAAHKAFSSRKNYDLRVIQLYRKNNMTDGRVLDRKLIESGLEGNIDLR